LQPIDLNAKGSAKVEKAHNRILRCRRNAADRTERRIYAAELGVRRNLSCTQVENEPKIRFDETDAFE
jgi:hypothetical protein